MLENLRLCILREFFLILLRTYKNKFMRLKIHPVLNEYRTYVLFLFKKLDRNINVKK
jgi:hypothetical protein